MFSRAVENWFCDCFDWLITFDRRSCVTKDDLLVDLSASFFSASSSSDRKYSEFAKKWKFRRKKRAIVFEVQWCFLFHAVKPFRCSWKISHCHARCFWPSMLFFVKPSKLEFYWALSIDSCRFMVVFLCERDSRFLTSFGGGVFFPLDIHSRSHFRHHKSASKFKLLLNCLRNISN